MVNQRTRDFILNKGPLILKAICGFMSSVTVTINSLIFLWTTYILVIELHGQWPNTMKLFVMFIGPIVTSLHFINSVSVLTALFKTDDVIDKDKVEEMKTRVVNQTDVTIERELFGDLAVLLRAVAGFITVNGICAGSLLFTYTIHLAVSDGGLFPPDRTLAIVVIGPIIASWTFMKANTTLKQLLESKGIMDYAKGKLRAYLDNDNKK